MAPSCRSRWRPISLANLAFVSCLRCGQGRGRVPPPKIHLDRPLVNGIYPLASYPDCSGAYNGQDANETLVYVVGYGTEHERLFRRTQRAEYVAYYNSFNGDSSIWYDYADRFCADAMRDLLGS